MKTSKYWQSQSPKTVYDQDKEQWIKQIQLDAMKEGPAMSDKSLRCSDCNTRLEKSSHCPNCNIASSFAAPALLAHTVSQLQEQENLSRAIAAKCKKKKNETMAKYYQGQADAFRQVRDYLCANGESSNPALTPHAKGKHDE